MNINGLRTLLESIPGNFLGIVGPKKTPPRGSIIVISPPLPSPNTKKLPVFSLAKKLILVLLAFAWCHPVMASGILWTRVRGRVKAMNAQNQELTVETRDGDLFEIHVDGNVDVYVKDEIVPRFQDLKLDEKVVLLWNPKPTAPKDPEEPEPGGVYKPVR